MVGIYRRTIIPGFLRCRSSSIHSIMYFTKFPGVMRLSCQNGSSCPNVWQCSCTPKNNAATTTSLRAPNSPAALSPPENPRRGMATMGLCQHRVTTPPTLNQSPSPNQPRSWAERTAMLGEVRKGTTSYLPRAPPPASPPQPTARCQATLLPAAPPPCSSPSRARALASQWSRNPKPREEVFFYNFHHNLSASFQTSPA